MTIIFFIIYLNSFVWLIVPIRQYKTRSFLFFMLLGLFDPIFILAHHFFRIDLSFWFLVGTGLLSFGAFCNLSKNSRVILSLTLTAISIISALYYKNNYLLILLSFHIIYLFNFLNILVKDFSIGREIKYFFIILITYESSLIVKFFLTISFQEIAAAYFHFTSIIQILIGIAFLFINEKNSKAVKFI